MGRLSTRSAGIAGVIFVILIAVPGFASGAPPSTDDPAAKFATYIASNRSGLIFASIAGAAADFFVVFFLGGLYTALRRLGASAGLLIASLIAILLTGASAAAGGVIQAATAFRFNGPQHVDASIAQLAVDISAMAFVLAGFTLAAFLLVTAAMMSTAGRFPRWLAWVGFIGAPLEVIGVLTAVGTSGFFGLEGPAGLVFGLLPFGIFMLSTSIVMIVRGAAIDGATDVARAAVPAAPLRA